MVDIYIREAHFFFLWRDEMRESTQLNPSLIILLRFTFIYLIRRGWREKKISSKGREKNLLNYYQGKGSNPGQASLNLKYPHQGIFVSQYALALYVCICSRV